MNGFFPMSAAYELEGVFTGANLYFSEYATINFGGNTKEVSERSVVGESNEERSSTTKKNSKK